jgi:hypothetical protein
MGRVVRRRFRSLLVLAAGGALVAVAAACTPTKPPPPDPCAANPVVINHTPSQCTWQFQRDPANATMGGFTNEAHSIGSGSLKAGPISDVPAEKYVAEDFIATPVADLTSIAYDFQIHTHTATPTTDYKHFYLNVYANFDSSTDNFYDCKYDYVPTAGSDSSFTTMTAVASAAPTSMKDGTFRTHAACPPTLSGMPTGSSVRAFALNVGDTSASDAGLSGYLDNVQVTTTAGTKTSDFEPPAP